MNFARLDPNPDLDTTPAPSVQTDESGLATNDNAFLTEAGAAILPPNKPPQNTPRPNSADDDDDDPTPAAPAAKRPSRLLPFIPALSASIGFTVPLLLASGNTVLGNWSKFAHGLTTGDPLSFAVAGITATAFGVCALAGSTIIRGLNDAHSHAETIDHVKEIKTRQTRQQRDSAAIASELSEIRSLLVNRMDVDIVDDADPFWDNWVDTAWWVGGQLTTDVLDRTLGNGQFELISTKRLHYWARRLANPELRELRMVGYAPETTLAFRPRAWRSLYKLQHVLTEAEKLCYQNRWVPNMAKVRISLIAEQQPLPPSFICTRKLATGQTEDLAIQYYQTNSSERVASLGHTPRLALLRGALRADLKQDCVYEWYRGVEVSRDELQRVLETGDVPTRRGGFFDNGDHIGFE